MLYQIAIKRYYILYINNIHVRVQDIFLLDKFDWLLEYISAKVFLKSFFEIF